MAYVESEISVVYYFVCEDCGEVSDDSWVAKIFAEEAARLHEKECYEVAR